MTRVMAALFAIHALVLQTLPEPAQAATAAEIMAAYPSGGPDMVAAIAAEISANPAAANDFLGAIALGSTAEAEMSAVVAGIYESVESYSIAGNPSQGLILQNQVENWITYFSSPTSGDPDAIGRVLAGAQALTDGYSYGRVGTIVANSGNEQLQDSFEVAGGESGGEGDTSAGSGGGSTGEEGGDPVAGDPGCGDPPC